MKRLIAAGTVALLGTVCLRAGRSQGIDITISDVSGCDANPVTGAERNQLTWPTIRLLQAICRRAKSPGTTIRYAPADWLNERPTPKRRQRWSRWTRRMAAAGLIERTTEPARDRVTHVRVTDASWRWAESLGLLDGINLEMIEESKFADSASF